MTACSGRHGLRENNKGGSRFVYPLLRFAVSFGAIGMILYLFRAQLPAVILQLKEINPGYFLAAIGLFFFGLIFVAVRLRFVLKAQETTLSFSSSYYVNMIAVFFNNVLPSQVGGDMVKAYYIYKSSNGKLATFSAVVVDRLFGLVTMMLIGSVAVFAYDNALSSPRILSSLAILVAVTFIMAILIFNRRVANILEGLRLPLVSSVLLDKLKEIYQAMYDYRERKGIIIACLMLTVAAQSSFVFANFMLAESLTMDISVGFFFFFVPIILILGIAPSVNGMGIREAAYLFYLTEFTSPDKALTLSLLTSFFMIVVGVIGGIFYAFIGGLPEKSD